MFHSIRWTILVLHSQDRYPVLVRISRSFVTTSWVRCLLNCCTSPSGYCPFHLCHYPDFRCRRC
ncbi:hypothetical protein [Pseudomonas phage PIP]|nr:hypothetical protein [Pseudomonas phage PIP]